MELQQVMNRQAPNAPQTHVINWHPADWPEDSPWMKLFYNARAWVG